MNIEDRILYEDNHIIIVNKLTSEICQGDKTGDMTIADTVKKFIKARDNKPGNVFLGITHRLDRPTSGTLVLAKTSKALSRMNELFRKGEVDKYYWAAVSPAPKNKEDSLTSWMFRDRKKNKSFAHNSKSDGRKLAKLKYKEIAKGDNYTLLEIELITGRHHQIRAQLSSIGSYIKGDLKYGAKRSNPGGGISLHSRRIKFIHPVSKIEIDVVAPVPEQDKVLHDLELMLYK